MSPKVRGVAAILFIFLCALGVALLYVGKNLDGIVAGLIEEHGTAATGTAVDVGGVSIQLSDARGEISGLTIDNPPGFDASRALEFGSLSLKLDPSTLTENPVVIEEIVADRLRINVEQSGSSNNLRELLAALTAGSEDEQPSAEARKIVINRLVLSGASAEVFVPDIDERRSVQVPDIVLRDIGRQSGGATASQAARQILEPVLKRVLESAAVEGAKQRLLDRIGEEGGDIARGLLDKLSGDDAENENENE